MSGRDNSPRERDVVADPNIPYIQKEFGGKGLRRERYASLMIGESGWWPLLRYEFILLASAWVPGALGLFLRSKLYPLILGRVGKNVAFGQHVVLRHPRKIFIGDNVVIDDHCCLDAKGTTNRGIELHDGVFLGRNTILSCKNGDIVLESDANVGFNVEIASAGRVRVGARTLIAAYTYLVGGDHLYGRTDIPVLYQGGTSAGIDVAENCWLGAHVVVTDGARLGRDVIVGAGSVVIGEVAPFHIVVGSPARLIRDRRAPSDNV